MFDIFVKSVVKLGMFNLMLNNLDVKVVGKAGESILSPKRLGFEPLK